jgi:hypothetical protein
MISDIIDGNYFQSLANCSIGDDILPQKPILYSSTCNYEEALEFIKNNPDKQFKLITHNSDRCVTNCEVPDNLIRWYAQNLDFDHVKIEPIPIGLENQHWHPSKRSVLNTILDSEQRPRIDNVALCQFNPDTYPKERHPLFTMCENGTVAGDCYFCVNGLDFNIYAENLLNYKFALCPRGNGLDTHRLWEAILLGCVPIVKSHHSCYNYDIGLPVIFIDSWHEVTENFLKNKAESVQEMSFDTPILFKSYWKERILNANS